MAAGPGTTAGMGPAAGIAEEEDDHVKPFTPEKAKEIVMSLRQPAIFCNMVFDWPAQHWTAKHLSEVLHGKQIRFRMGMKGTDTGKGKEGIDDQHKSKHFRGKWPEKIKLLKEEFEYPSPTTNSANSKRDPVPQFETTCSYVEATLEEFLTWNCGHSSSGPFRDYDNSKFWAYADYKYIVNLFEDKTDIFQDVIWSDFGFHGRNGRESTLWIGSLGARTPCHLDTYGCNLVFQVQGRKRWHLFPPEDTPFLYPTRIPYEESSVFSKISVVNPDLKRFPQFQKARRHVVTLSPGQVLLVPRHWWHYVESIDPVTVSINSWIELEEDHQARVEEAVTRTLVCALKTAEDPHNTRAWLNPTEGEDTSHEVNCLYLNRAVSAYFDHYKTSKIAEIQASRRNKEYRKKEEFNVHNLMEVDQTGSQNFTLGTAKQEAASLFGPDLVPVLPCSEAPPSERGSLVKNDGKDFVGKDGEHFGKLHRTEEQHMMNKTGKAAVEQITSHSTMAPPRTLISTDDLLDCLVHPLVTNVVAQLLIQVCDCNRK